MRCEAYFYLVPAKSQIFFYYSALAMKTVFTQRIKIYHHDMMAYLHALLHCAHVSQAVVDVYCIPKVIRGGDPSQDLPLWKYRPSDGDPLVLS